MEINLGIYRHYKGGEYEVVAVGRLEATLEEVVIYKSLYEVKEFPAGTIWVRPTKSFIETIDINGKTIPRFAYVEKNRV